MNIEIIPDGIDTDKKQILTQQHEDLAEYCQNCYVDAHLKLYDHIDDSDVGIQCHFIVKNEQLIVVFRGSNEFKDWFFNFIMTQTEYPKGSGIYIHTMNIEIIPDGIDTGKKKNSYTTARRSCRILPKLLCR